ncbi:MAG: Sapep family Mn(2+)-dependent dipeptidase [Euryarchaeota archaeon]|nr:Sapep family Mn(2+)-dependent dipeptidase [Euryarchaeota archaeon]
MSGQAQALADRIDPTVEKMQDVYVSFLAGLLRFRTVSGSQVKERDELFLEERKRAWRFLRIEAERLGLDFRLHDEEAAVIEWTGRDPDADTLGIATHLDVVPATGDWTRPPFAGAVVDGEIWGRGAQDDKGPIAMALAAIDTLQRLDIPPRGTVRIFIGSREETTDWPDIDLLLEREEEPHRVLVPDGAFPIGIGEKGIATLEWSTRWDRSSEERGGDLLRFVDLVGGDRANVVPGDAHIRFAAPPERVEDAREHLETACVELSGLSAEAETEIQPVGSSTDEDEEQMVVTFHGRSAHAAIPHHGHNAVLDALTYLTLIPELDPEVVTFARFLHRHTRAIDGSGIEIDRTHPRFGDTTLNLGRARFDAHGATATLNIRFPLGTTTDDVVDACQSAAEDAACNITTERIGRLQEPFLCDPEEHPVFFDAMRTAYQTVTGSEPKTLTIAGTTYAKLFENAVGFGPVDLSRDEPVLVHQTDERVSVERYLENIRIYALTIALLACDT